MVVQKYPEVLCNFRGCDPSVLQGDHKILTWSYISRQEQRLSLLLTWILHSDDEMLSVTEIHAETWLWWRKWEDELRVIRIAVVWKRQRMLPHLECSYSGRTEEDHVHLGTSSTAWQAPTSLKIQGLGLVGHQWRVYMEHCLVPIMSPGMTIPPGN